MERDRMTLGALLGLGRDGEYVRKRSQRFAQRDDPRRVDSIVIGNQEEWAVRHALNDLSRMHAAGKGTEGLPEEGSRELREGRRAFALRSANGRGDWI